MKCKVFITSDLNPGMTNEEIERILPASLFEIESFRDNDNSINEKMLTEVIQNYDVVVTTVSNKITKNQLKGKRVQLISNIAVGFDNIDLDAAKKENVSITNTPDTLNETTAEMAVTLLLNAMRKVKIHQHHHVQGNCSHWRPFFELGSELRGKEIGIVGLGRIGKEIARILHYGFNCQINYLKNETIHQLEFPTNPMFHKDFFSTQKVIILSAPLNKKTTHIIDTKEITLLNPGAILVNIGRGELVNQEALTDNLQKFSTIATDVTTPDPLPADHPLMSSEKVFITPHIGSATNEARKAMVETALKNVRGHFDSNYEFSPHYVF